MLHPTHFKAKDSQKRGHFSLEFPVKPRTVPNCVSGLNTLQFPQTGGSCEHFFSAWATDLQSGVRHVHLTSDAHATLNLRT